MNPLRLFTEHPRSVGETYGEHMASALSFTGPLLVAGLACLVHAFLPFLFPATASGKVRKLNERMVVHRIKAPQADLRLASGE